MKEENGAYNVFVTWVKFGWVTFCLCEVFLTTELSL